MFFSKTKFFIVGISRSGRTASELLLGLNAVVYLYDSAPTDEIKRHISELCEKGAVIVADEDVKKVICDCDVVVLSPGVPVDAELPAFAAEKGKCVIGELELASLVCRAPIVAVTGTNGKTTVCSLLYHVICRAGEKGVLAGNVGTPLSSVVGECDFDTTAVVEISSFQLETTRRFAPHVACVLNVTPDHMSRHYNMENYVYLKSKIFANLCENEYAVLNADDDIVCRMSDGIKAKKIYFSSKKQTNGAYVEDGKIFWRGKEIVSVADLRLKGIHNVENALAVVCMAKVLGIADEKIADGVTSFAGVRHRQEKILEYGGVTFIDDSKATNPDSALKAVECSGKSIVLLVGGIDKGVGYNVFFEKLKECGKVRAAVIYGRSRKELYRCAENAGLENLYLSVGFDCAVKTACQIAVSGDVVLLSPACSSFDEFSCFEERGDAFCSIVKEFVNGLQNKKAIKESTVKELDVDDDADE